MAKRALIFIILVMVLQIQLVKSINLEVTKEVINEVIIKELDNNASFNFNITNLEEDDEFQIYTLVGVEMTPNERFFIGKNESKIIHVEVQALSTAKKTSGYYNFAYKIKNSKNEKQDDFLKIKLVDLKDAFAISADSITPDTEKTKVYIQNKEEFDFKDINAEFSSVFFSFKKSFDIQSLEKKEFEAELNENAISTLVAGPYMINADITLGETTETIESTIKFLEKSGMLTNEAEEGWLIQRQEIEKTNEGNLPVVAEIHIRKNWLESMITSFNLPEEKKEYEGASVVYTWKKELRPSESLKVVAKTNWLIILIVFIILIVLIIIYRKYIISSIVLKKTISPVKTKGGEFALKVKITAKAKKFVENINIVDKLPQILKLYERYGAITPDKIDEKNRRLEWNIESLDEGEERVLSYIVYSKIGVMGKFELPPAKVIYEQDGRIKEDDSNRVFYVAVEKSNKQ